MIFTNQKLELMHQKFKKYNYKYSKYYERMASDSRFEHKKNVLLNNAYNIRNCMTYWEWHLYVKNKLLDLQKVVRCNCKTCPNCRSWNLAKAIANFKPAHEEMVSRGYVPFLLTLTIPNVTGDKLEETVNKLLSVTLRRFLHLYNDRYKKDAFSSRYFDIMAAVSVLEITIKKDDKNSYHPHLHLIVYLDNLNEIDFEKNIRGAYRKKSKSNIYFSYADLQISILWYMAWNGITFHKNKYKQVEDDFEKYYVDFQRDLKSYPDGTWCGIYMCDIRPLTSIKGVYEVFKYTYKDSDINNYENFTTIYSATFGKRIRQTHGELYKLNLEKETGEKQALEEYLQVQEIPQKIITTRFNELYIDYHDYQKISRFKAYEELENIN